MAPSPISVERDFAVSPDGEHESDGGLVVDDVDADDDALLRVLPTLGAHHRQVPVVVCETREQGPSQQPLRNVLLCGAGSGIGRSDPHIHVPRTHMANSVYRLLNTDETFHMDY